MCATPSVPTVTPITKTEMMESGWVCRRHRVRESRWWRCRSASSGQGWRGGGEGHDDDPAALARVFSTAEGAAGGELRLSLGPPSAGGDVDTDVYRL
eukprot:COSAG01_NODE_955_length_12483_cov_19.703731_3_plen_97_part_00